jgi:hypothetical protein
MYVFSVLQRSGSLILVVDVHLSYVMVSLVLFLSDVQGAVVLVRFTYLTSYLLFPTDIIVPLYLTYQIELTNETEHFIFKIYIFMKHDNLFSH